MPRSIAVSTTGRSAREPARWPSATGTPCSEAQRPFPSMMIATACATSGRCSSGVTSVPGRDELRPPSPRPLSTPRSAAHFAGAPRASRGRAPLYLHHFSFLVLEELVDLLRVLVRQLLDTALGAVLLVGADLALVDELLEMPHRVAADLAHGDSVVFRHIADNFYELLPPLLGELRDRQPDQLAVVRGRQAEIRLLDRLLDRLDRARVEHLHREHARLGNVDRRELAQRCRRPVVVDLDPVEERGGRAPGADGRELRPPVLDRLRHAFAGGLDELFCSRHSVSPPLESR